MVVAAGACLGAAGSASGGAKPAQLRVVQIQLPGSFYIEGSYSYIRIERPDGRKVLQRRLPARRRPTLTVSLRAGSYRLVSWQRPCDGNCGYLDPPTDRCARGFTLKRGQLLKATIRLKAGSGCRISFAS